MSFLVLMLAIVIEKMSSWRTALQKDRWWYAQLQRRAKHSPKHSSLALILSPSLPILG